MTEFFLFLDESGDHSLDKIDSDYPVFVLGGALFTKDEYAQVEFDLTACKLDLFGSEKIILHTADMTRNRKGYEKMKEENYRKTIYAGINSFMENAIFRAMGCVIRKNEHLKKYGLTALDPYHLSLHIIVERAYFAMGKHGKLHLFVESRNASLDRMFEAVFLELKIKGTSFLSPSQINSLAMELHIREKKANIAGLQIADLLVSPMGRYVIGKRMHEDWEIIKAKLHRYKGNWQGAGLVILPKS